MSLHSSANSSSDKEVVDDEVVVEHIMSGEWLRVSSKYVVFLSFPSSRAVQSSVESSRDAIKVGQDVSELISGREEHSDWLAAGEKDTSSDVTPTFGILVRLNFATSSLDSFRVELAAGRDAPADRIDDPLERTWSCAKPLRQLFA
jgi:hypothetical protein